MVGTTGIEWGKEDQDSLKALIRYQTQITLSMEDCLEETKESNSVVRLAMTNVSNGFEENLRGRANRAWIDGEYIATACILTANTSDRTPFTNWQHNKKWPYNILLQLCLWSSLLDSGLSGSQPVNSLQLLLANLLDMHLIGSLLESVPVLRFSSVVTYIGITESPDLGV